MLPLLSMYPRFRLDDGFKANGIYFDGGVRMREAGP